MSFAPIQLLPDGIADTDNVKLSTSELVEQRLDDKSWIPVLQHKCDFGPGIFEQVSINLIRNPNINSSHLFRADILYDSLNNEHTNTQWSPEEVERLLQEYALEEGSFPGFQIKRTLMRLMVPRNPQLDKPIAQTCYILHSTEPEGRERSLVVYVPHVSQLEALPWYHPAVQCLAYLHTWKLKHDATSPHNDFEAASQEPGDSQGWISIHFRIFPTQTLPLPSRVMRTARHLLSTLYKHGQGNLAGYTKRVNHDQLISQQRVQDTYANLKREHAKRLCDAWVEQTEPSKHVFEDLGIAAFLIELWKDMYRPLGSSEPNDARPVFPGFVDIGCGNGVLTEILILSGYKGWGFDVRRRKTWSILSTATQSVLKELVLVPSPLFDLHATSPTNSIISLALSPFLPQSKSTLKPPTQPWYDGIFPKGTFIISNHADELTPWTPLLASLSSSPFLAIPCCSHNLSGMRFRAPSIYNSHTADTNAPSYFSKNVTKSKSVAISILPDIGTESSAEESESEDPDSEFAKFLAASEALSVTTPPTTTDPYGPQSPKPSPNRPSNDHSTESSLTLAQSHSTRSYPSEPPTPTYIPSVSAVHTPTRNPSTGDLKALAPSARAKQPSAYSSLCNWVSHLATEVGYVVEKEVLRIPSTRNVGIIGRSWVDGRKEGEEDRRKRVVQIAKREGANGRMWMQRCLGLMKAGDKGDGHGDV